MVPTAEVPLTGLHMDEILEEADLPRFYTAYTPCFRREKMSAGRDVRGIKRGHQFDKVEMYIYLQAGRVGSHAARRCAQDAEETCRQLGFTYRVKQLCTGDIGFGSSITYDLEVWAAGLRGMAGSLVGLERDRFPGPPGQHQIPPGGRRAQSASCTP